MLERAGYTVLEAATGSDATRIWELFPDTIHLLLTDIVLPEGMSGRELAALIQTTSPGLPVIFTSGYNVDVAARQLSLKQGENFVQKPFTRRSNCSKRSGTGWMLEHCFHRSVWIGPANTCLRISSRK